jgi:hypothetical protein
MNIFDWFVLDWFTGGIFWWVAWIPIMIIIVVISALVALIKWLVEKIRESNKYRSKLKESRYKPFSDRKNNINKAIKFCKYCGKRLSNNPVFCVYCGKKVTNY